MSKSQASLNRATSPTKRGYQLNKNQPSQTQTLSYKDVRQILDSCRNSFNSDLKRSRKSPPNSTDRTLRAKTMNSKVERKSSGESVNNMKKQVTKSAPNSPVIPPPGSARVPMSVVRDVLQDCAIENHQKRTAASKNKSTSAPVSPSGKLPVKRSSSSSSPGDQNSSNPKRMKVDNINNTVTTTKPPTKGTPKRSYFSQQQHPNSNSKKKSAPMDEVMKLHQDEGVMHLLHALPTSRRKIKTNLFNSSSFKGVPNHNSNKKNVNHNGSTLLTTYNGKDANYSGLISRQPSKKGPAAAKRNNLVKVNSDNVKSVSPDDLMNPKILEMLKKLPKKDYLHLWSSTSRYKLTEDSMMLCNNLPLLKQSSVSPDSSSTTSDISSASTLATSILRAQQAKKIGDRMLLNVSNITKQYKDLMIRSYPNFASIIMAPTTTGLKYSFNVNMFEEITEVLDLLRDNAECKAVVLTGLGNIFSQGVDLTTLTHDSVEKQRKSAEAMANAIKNFIKCLLNYPKLLVAAVNGQNSGLGVVLLPYFDIVYANDKATLNVDYCKLGQIPEAFASVTLNPLVMNEMVLLGRSYTAEEGVQKGLVSSVFFPDRFFEEIVPRLENMENFNMNGVQMTKMLMKQNLKKKVMEVMEEETKNLVKCWTVPDYGKNLKLYLKSANDILFQ